MNDSSYALVIADLHLPDGNGLDVAEYAAELGLKTAIISGYIHQLEAKAADRQK